MVKLELTEKELEYIVAVLMRQPFLEVNQLLQKLILQANKKEDDPQQGLTLGEVPQSPQPRSGNTGRYTEE